MLTRKIIQGRLMQSVLRGETKTRIIEDVTCAFRSWNDSRSMGLREHFIELPIGVKVLGLMLDAVYKHHCHGALNVEALPSDTELGSLYRETIDVMLKQPLSEQEKSDLQAMKGNIFRPAMRETFDILYKEFDKLPLLSEKAPEHRWRFLVDRNTLDLLAQHGLDDTNPLLCFIFDMPKAYANETAKEWVAGMSDIASPFTPEKALEISRSGMSAGLATSFMKFAAIGSPAGRLRLADSMRALAEQGVVTVLEIGSHAYMQTPKGAQKYVQAPSAMTDSAEPMLAAEANSVRELLEAEKTYGNANLIHIFQRGPIPGRNEQEKEEKLKNAITDSLSPITHVLHELETAESETKPTSAEVEFAAAQTFLDEHTLHPMDDGNFRLWGQVGPNLWFAKAGLGLSLLHDPRRSRGASYQEVEPLFREGAKFCRLLSIEVRDAIKADPAAYFAELPKHVSEGRYVYVEELVTAARLYPDYSPPASMVRDLLDTALRTGQSSQIKLALTRLPHFDLHAKEPGRHSWLTYAAMAEDHEFCSHLLRMGSDPNGIGRDVQLAPQISRLLVMARTLHKFSPGIKASNSAEWDSTFKALKSYDMRQLSARMDEIRPDLTHENALHHFIDACASGQSKQALVILAKANSELRQHAASLRPEDLKEMLFGINNASGRSLLHRLIQSHDPAAAVFLACLPALLMPHGADLMLEIVTEIDRSGAPPLHHAVNSDNLEATLAILDLIDQPDIPVEEKLKAYSLKDRQDSTAFELAADFDIATAIFERIVGLPTAGRLRLEAFIAKDEDGRSSLDRWAELENDEMIGLCLGFVHKLIPELSLDDKIWLRQQLLPLQEYQYQSVRSLVSELET